jgi:hypothetical protein
MIALSARDPADIGPAATPATDYVAKFQRGR